MSFKKFSELPTLSGASVAAADDYLPINDASVADASKNKRITVAELAAALNASIVHNTLSGLTTGDPHTQYPVLVPGSSTRNVFQSSGTTYRTMALQALTGQTADLLNILDKDGNLRGGWIYTIDAFSNVQWQFVGYALANGRYQSGFTLKSDTGNDGFTFHGNGGRSNGPTIWANGAGIGQLLAGSDANQADVSKAIQNATFFSGLGNAILNLTTTSVPLLVASRPSSTAADILRIGTVSAYTSAPTIKQRFDKGGYLINKLVSAPADSDLSASEIAPFYDATNSAAAAVWKMKEAGGTVRHTHVRASQPWSITSGQEAGGTNECVATFTIKDWAGNTCPQNAPALVWINTDAPDSWSVTGALDLNKWGSVDSVQGPVYGEFSAGELVVAVTQSLGTVGTIHVLCLTNGLKASISPSDFGA